MQPPQNAQNNDTEKPNVPDHGTMKPLLRNFITKRHEDFGGYLYNPYLLNPVAFSQSEMRTIDLFDGKNSLTDIVQFLQQSMGSNEAAKSLLKACFEKLNRMFAVKLTKKDQAASAIQPIHSIDPDPYVEPSTAKNFLTAPLSVLWDITYCCNLHCQHCLSGAGVPRNQELTTDEAERIIDELADLKVFTITFCGGEPFLRKDLFHLLGYASNRNIGLKISTNGTLVSETVVKQLDDFNVFAVQVSLDGNEKSHDRLRNKAGAYRKAVNAIKLFVEAGYYTVVAPVVTRINIQDIDAIIDTAASLGASAFKPSLFMPAGRGKTNQNELSLPKEEVRAIMSKLGMKQKEYEGDLQIHLETKYPTSGENICSIREHGLCCKDAQVGCSAGNTQIVVTATGDIVACPFLYEFIAGNLRQDSLHKIWHTSKVLDTFRGLRQSDLKGKCNECQHVPEQCLGGCRAAAYLYSGDLYGEDPLCWA